jgi:hypothetical protein
MPTYNILMQKRNADNTGWDQYLPITNAENVFYNETETVKEKIDPLLQKVIFASNCGFTGGAGDAAILQNILENNVADIFYVDTTICIDTGIMITSKVKKIVGHGGNITLTNKGTSKVPWLKWEYCDGMVFEFVDFLGDIDKSLTTDTEFQNNLVTSMFLSHCNNIIIRGCTFKNIIGAGAIVCRYCSGVIVKDDYIIDCWNHISGDYQGDGIYIGFTTNTHVFGNYILNTLTDVTKYGRIGVCFEFAGTNSCTCVNNVITGYDRAVHIELVDGPILVKNNVVEGCPMGFIAWDTNNSDIDVDGNYFSNEGVPATYVPQLVQGSRGFVSFYSNTPTAEVNKNTVFRNNTCRVTVNVPGVDRLIFTKITGETYSKNKFIDSTRTKTMFMYNPTESGTVNNNKLTFVGNEVSCKMADFAHIGRHQINDNNFDVDIFRHVCTPTHTLNFSNREFMRNIIRNGDSGIVGVETYIFMSNVSIMCVGNTFRDITAKAGQQNALLTTRDYSATPGLKSVFDNNTLISTQDNTITLLFFGRMDGCMHPTNSNKHITNTGIGYEQSGVSNKALVVTASDGSERVITVGTDGVLSAATVQRSK